jgi:DNA-binding transcriptional MerR regulator
MSNEEKLFYSIGEVAEILQLKAYVLRYWETEFKKLTPKKSFTGQRTYRPRDIQVALTIKKLLYDDKYTIAGAIQKLDELDSKKELVSFPNAEATTTAEPITSPTKLPQPPVDSIAASNEPVTPVIPAVEAPIEILRPPVDVQKVKDLKTLVDATKKLLKKYNLS